MFRKKNYLEDFVRALSNLEAVEFLGVCRLLSVSLIKNEDTPRDFKELLYAVIDSYARIKPKKQKELLKLVREASKSQK